MKLKPFSSHTGLVLPLDISNVDTDLIIPKQYLKSVKKVGFGPYLFDELRYLDSAEYGDDCSKRKLNTEFILNKEEYKGVSVLLARENFGCGSSREHAPWALLDFGIQCVISNSFADIFFNNSVKNGLLLIKLNKNEIQKLSELAMKKESFTVDLINQKISVKNNEINFNVDPIIKDRLIHGYDDIEITLKNKQLIVDYENNKNKFHIWKNIVYEKQ